MVRQQYLCACMAKLHIYHRIIFMSHIQLLLFVVMCGNDIECHHDNCINFGNEHIQMAYQPK